MSETSGDFAPIIDEHWAKIYRLAVRMTGQPSEADEIAQETFFRAFRSYSKFEGRSKVETWLYRIAVNVCKKRMIDQKRRQATTLDAVTVEARVEISHIERGETQDLLLRAFGRVSPAHRLVLALSVVEGLIPSEIAEILECKEGTVWSRLHHARNAMATVLRELDPEVDS
jgi:RNA polymerase sigma-70 factor (ECF subfamily)